MTIILGVTGHRKLRHSYPSVYQFTKNYIEKLAPVEVITGMALGFDQIVAEVCVEINIPFCAAIPCKEQEKMWNKMQKEKYHSLVAKASRVVYVDDGEYAPWKMQKRNQWIVDNCTEMLSYWDGSKEGGTANCLKYAKNTKRPVEFVRFPKNHPILKSLYNHSTPEPENLPLPSQEPIEVPHK